MSLAVDEEYSAEPTSLETFTLTIPDKRAPRGRELQGLPIRMFRLSPEAAQELEDSLVRVNPQERSQVRLYRGTRLLLPELGDDDEQVLARPPPPPVVEDATLREAERHLNALNESIRLAQERLRLLDAQEQKQIAEVEAARGRRDRELASHLALVEASQASCLKQIVQAREHTTREQLRAFEMDTAVQEQITASWASVANTSQHLGTVRKVLGDSVLADRTKEWLLIFKDVATNVADSPLGKMMTFHAAEWLARTVNKILRERGKPDDVKAEHIMVTYALVAQQFAERRKMLQAYAQHCPKAVGQALLLAPDFCLGEADPAAIRELIEQAREADEAGGKR